MWMWMCDLKCSASFRLLHRSTLSNMPQRLLFLTIIYKKTPQNPPCTYFSYLVFLTEEKGLPIPFVAYPFLNIRKHQKTNILFELISL